MPEGNSASPYKALFSPFKLGHLTLKNRIISTSHAPSYADNGMPAERYQRYHEEKARGGLALSMFGGASSVSIDSPASFGQLDVSDNRIVPYFKAFADRLHAYDVPLMCQLSHAGRRTVPTAGNWLPTVAPSALREPAHGAMPKQMELADIERIIDDYAAAARRCSDGGLDGIELLASGHLLGQFWSPLSNLREDDYGGSLDNRLRFGLQVLTAIRASVRQDFIVSLRFTANEFIDGGIDEAEGLRIASAHADSGLIDCLNVSGGANWTKAGVAETVPSMAFSSGRFIELAGKVRRVTGLPVLHAAGVADLATANHAVAEAHVDLIGMTRAHIADPHLVNKHLAGRDAEIRPCVGAGYCIDRIYRGGDALCLHNPVTGREGLLSHLSQPTPQPRHVVVVGAGPAGLEAARLSAERGHRVTLFEAQADAGGQVYYAARIAWRQNMIGITRWLHQRCDALGVEFHFNRYIDVDDIESLAADIVILATGGLPALERIDGGEAYGHTVWDILSGEIPPAAQVLVYDETGSQSGPTVCEFLAEAGSQVVLMTPDRMAAEDVGVTNHAIHLRNMYAAGVAIVPDQRLQKLSRTDNRITAHTVNEYSGLTQQQQYDQVVIDIGTVPSNQLFDTLAPLSQNRGQTDLAAWSGLHPQPVSLHHSAPPTPTSTAIEDNTGKNYDAFLLYRIGDCISHRGIHAAMLDAHRLCATL